MQEQPTGFTWLIISLSLIVLVALFIVIRLFLRRRREPETVSNSKLLRMNSSIAMSFDEEQPALLKPEDKTVELVPEEQEDTARALNQIE